MQTPNVASGSDIDEEPSCGAGETLIGGGGLFVLPSTTTVANNSVRITGSGPASGTNASQSPSNWYVAGNNFSGSPLDFIGYAVCASP